MLPKKGKRKKVVIKYWGEGTDIPDMPTAAETHAAVLAAGAGTEAADRMRRERHDTEEINRVNAEQRKHLIEAGDGYYDTSLHCSAAPDRSGSLDSSNTDS